MLNVLYPRSEKDFLNETKVLKLILLYSGNCSVRSTTITSMWSITTKLMRNCFNLNEEYTALYYTPSFINHSCIPNCNQQLVEEDLRMRVIALRDIKQGEEISISYMDTSKQQKDIRRKNIKEKFNFDCQCLDCTQSNSVQVSKLNIDRFCSNCGKSGGKFQKCGKCKLVYYCNKKCQLENWNTFHKKTCFNNK